MLFFFDLPLDDAASSCAPLMPRCHYARTLDTVIRLIFCCHYGALMPCRRFRRRSMLIRCRHAFAAESPCYAFAADAMPPLLCRLRFAALPAAWLLLLPPPRQAHVHTLSSRLYICLGFYDAPRCARRLARVADFASMPLRVVYAIIA